MQLLKTMDIKKYSLGSEFHDSKARICTIDGVRRIAVIDLVHAVSGTSLEPL
jgi:hypothetical protein